MYENIIIAVFGANRETRVRPRYRYDTGQRLIIKTPNGLPDFYEVYFSNDGSTADSDPHLATNEGVLIPNSYFESGATIYAWAHVYDLATEGTTIYKVTIPILNRARPSVVEPDPEDENIIRQAIAEMNRITSEIEEMSDDIKESIQGADEAAENANAAAKSISTIDMSVEMLDPTADPTADVIIGKDGTQIDLRIPKSNIAYGTFEVEQDTMELVLNSPENFPDIGFELNDGMLEVII